MASAVRSGAARFGAAGLWLPPLAFFAAFYFYPLARITALSFTRAEGPALGAFLEAVGSTAALRALRFTLWQATASTLLTLVVGLPGAYFLARYSFRGKATIRGLTAVPFVLPTLVVAAAFDALAGPRGLVNQILMGSLGLAAPPIHFMNTFTAILVAHVFYNTTIVLRLVGDFWSHLDPDLAGAARVLGASRRQAALGITAPLLAPAVLAAALLVFIFDFTSFGVILVMGGPRFATLEVEIYYQTVSLFNLPMAASLSVVQLAATLGLTVIYTRLAHRLARPLDLRSRGSAEGPLVGRGPRLAAMAVLGGLLLLLVAPLVALVARSVMPVTRDAGGLTLDYFRALFANPRQSAFFASPVTAVGISLAYASTTVVLALAFGLPASWILARRPRGRGVRILDPLLMLPLGTSAVTLGLGFLVALNRPPIDFRASPLLVPLAHTLVAFPFVVRSLVPALESIKPQLVAAAAVLGASPRNAVRHVELPLVGRAVLVAATFAFMISLGEFGATALLSRPEYPTVPVAIYRFLSRPGAQNFGQAMALSTLLAAMTAAGLLAVERLRIAAVGEF